MSKHLETRVATARVVARVVSAQGSLTSALTEYLPQVAPRDQGLLQELCYGTLRWYPRLSAIVGSLLNKPLPAKDTDLAALLACTLYQLTATRVPAHAAVNSAVAACAALGKPWAQNMVNAVLRRFGREQAALEQALAAQPAYRSAHPRWLADSLTAAWPDAAAELLAANNERAPMTLRVNVRKTSRADYLQTLADAGIAATPTPYSAVGVQLREAAGIAQVPGFAEGLVSVQDEAAQLAAGLLDLRPGQRVLDACAAPGGKTTHILEREPSLAELIAVDSDARRLSRVHANLDRLALTAKLIAADAGAPASWWDGVPFDRILLDAPCSGTGVIRRHPDIKLLRQPEDIARAAALQLRLLQQLWPLLATGGLLLYATCSVLPPENDQTIAAFLAIQDAARSGVIATDAGRATRHGRQLFPQRDGHDGFYYALLAK